MIVSRIREKEFQSAFPMSFFLNQNQSNNNNQNDVNDHKMKSQSDNK